jgi:hypothetical protein
LFPPFIALTKKKRFAWVRLGLEHFGKTLPLKKDRCFEKKRHGQILLCDIFFFCFFFKVRHVCRKCRQATKNSGRMVSTSKAKTRRKMARYHRYKTFPKRVKYSGLEKSATHVRYAGTEKNCRMTQHKSLKKWQNVQKQRFQKNNENDLKRNVRKRLTECPETKVPKNTSRLTGNEGPKKRMAERLETKVQKSKAA